MGTKTNYSIKTNFSSGQMSGDMEGRTDVSFYNNAVKNLDNWLPDIRGGLMTRPGTVYVAETKDSSAVSRLIHFEFSTTQAYMIEAGNLYFRFFTQQGRLQEANKNVTGAANNGGGLVRITISSHGYSNGDYVAIRNVAGTTEANGDWAISGVTTNTFDLVGSSFSNAYTSAGTSGKIVQIVTPYLTAELFELRVAQSKDVMYICHRNHDVQKLARTSTTTFTLTEVVFTTPAFNDLNVTATTINPSGTTGSITLTASSGLFVSTDVGSYWRIGDRHGTPEKYGYVKVTGYTSATVVDATVTQALENANATDTWARPAWSDTDGHPEAVCFFEGRLLFGRDQTFWGSATDDFENYAYELDGDDDIAADAAYAYTIGSTTQNVIRWFAPLGFLFIGTAGGTQKVTGANDAGITPTASPLIRPQTTEGCAAITPVITGGDVVFVDRQRKRLINLEFNLNKDQYIGTDITLLSNDITGTGIKQIAIENTPNPVVYGVRNDGKLVSCSILRTQEVLAFATHSTDGSYESIATIPNDTLQRDETWIIVNRTVNSQTKRYVEYLNPDVALDSSLSRNSGAVSAVSGLEHLEAKSVVMIGDGAQYATKTVASGAVSFSPTATDITVGLSYTPTCTLFKPVWEIPGEGTTQSRSVTIGRMTFRVKDFLGLQVGSHKLPVRKLSQALTSAPVAETGDLSVPVSGMSGNVTFSQYLSIPGKILSVYQDLYVGES